MSKEAKVTSGELLGSPFKLSCILLWNTGRSWCYIKSHSKLHSKQPQCTPFTNLNFNSPISTCQCMDNIRKIPFLSLLNERVNMNIMLTSMSDCNQMNTFWFMLCYRCNVHNWFKKIAIIGSENRQDVINENKPVIIMLSTSLITSTQPWILS